MTEKKKPRDYGKFRPWKKTDSWVPIKKRWRKTWTKLAPNIQHKYDVAKVFDFSKFWKNEITSQENLKEWVEPNTPMSVIQACREIWLSYWAFVARLRHRPDLKEYWEQLKEASREYSKTIAHHNIEQAIWWALDITDKERTEFSFRLLEKTEQAFNPKVEIEQKWINLNFTKSTEDLVWELKTLLWNL